MKIKYEDFDESMLDEKLNEIIGKYRENVENVDCAVRSFNKRISDDSSVPSM